MRKYRIVYGPLLAHRQGEMDVSGRAKILLLKMIRRLVSSAQELGGAMPRRVTLIDRYALLLQKIHSEDSDLAATRFADSAQVNHRQLHP